MKLQFVTTLWLDVAGIKKNVTDKVISGDEMEIDFSVSALYNCLAFQRLD